MAMMLTALLTLATGIAVGLSISRREGVMRRLIGTRWWKVAAVAFTTLVLAAGGVTVTQAQSDPVTRVHRDCQDGDLDRNYSVPVLKRALRELPDDLRYYTDCEDVIEDEIRRKCSARPRPESCDGYKRFIRRNP
jgi:hypothetical protein